MAFLLFFGCATFLAFVPSTHAPVDQCGQEELRTVSNPFPDHDCPAPLSMSLLSTLPTGTILLHDSRTMPGHFHSAVLLNPRDYSNGSLHFVFTDDEGLQHPLLYDVPVVVHYDTRGFDIPWQPRGWRRSVVNVHAAERFFFEADPPLRFFFQIPLLSHLHANWSRLSNWSAIVEHDQAIDADVTHRLINETTFHEFLRFGLWAGAMQRRTIPTTITLARLAAYLEMRNLTTYHAAVYHRAQEQIGAQEWIPFALNCQHLTSYVASGGMASISPGMLVSARSLQILIIGLCTSCTILIVAVMHCCCRAEQHRNRCHWIAVSLLTLPTPLVTGWLSQLVVISFVRGGLASSLNAKHIMLVFCTFLAAFLLLQAALMALMHCFLYDALKQSAPVKSELLCTLLLVVVAAAYATVTVGVLVVSADVDLQKLLMFIMM